MPALNNRHLEVTFRDETFEYFPGQITPAMARVVRSATGMGPADLWRQWMADSYYEPDLCSLLLWLARMQAAKRLNIPSLELPLDAIEASMTYDDLLDHFRVKFVGYDEDVETAEVVEAVLTENPGELEVAVDPEG